MHTSTLLLTHSLHGQCKTRSDGSNQNTDPQNKAIHSATHHLLRTKHWKLRLHSPQEDGNFWNNRKGGTAEEGTPWELLPNTTQARIVMYLRYIQTCLNTYQNAFFLKSDIEKP